MSRLTETPNGHSTASVIPFRPEHNGSHFPLSENGRKTPLWREWWYTNFHDPRRDIHGTLTFKAVRNLINPRHTQANIHFNLIKDGRPCLSRTEKFSLKEFSAETGHGHVVLGPNILSMKKPDVCTVDYTGGDGRTRLRLEYKRLTKGFTVAFRKGHWTVPLPLAEINGTVKLSNNAEPLKLNGWGYHDHNWGTFKEADVGWRWAEMGDPEKPLSVVFGAAHQGPKRETVVVVATAANIFSPSAHGPVSVTEEPGPSSPSLLKRVTARQGETGLEFECAPRQTLVFNDMKKHLADFRVSVTRDGVRRTFNSPGFCEDKPAPAGRRDIFPINLFRSILSPFRRAVSSR